MPKQPTSAIAARRIRDQEVWLAHQAQRQRNALITLIDLVESDLDGLPNEQRQNLLSAMRDLARHVGMLVDPTSESHVETDAPHLSLDDVRDLQTPLREGFELLFPRGPWAPPLLWSPPVKVSGIEIGRGGSDFGLIYTVAWPDAFWFATMQLFRHHGSAVRRCAQCSRLYLRTKRQEYCTPACSQRARSQRWYDQHRNEVLDQRHKSYLAAHPKRKVPRRKRVKR